MSCAIPLKVYKYSKAVVRSGTREGEGESKEPDKLEARRRGPHSQGKHLSNIYSIDTCYKVECWQ